MSVYKDIIDWSTDKPQFFKDAIRRLLLANDLTHTDISELTLILKKEIGFTGISETAIAPTESDISSASLPTRVFAKLVSIKNPININALYDKAEIEFSQDGLTVIYGSNGSGKSSYSRILKKVCWSRQKQLELNPNVYRNNTTEQTFEINYALNGSSSSFNWVSDQEASEELNSVYVFDSKCADIYLNSENPTEYKPIGTDLLEKLIVACKTIESKINNEIAHLTIQKPELDSSKFSESKWFSWYNEIEKKKKEEIETSIQFTVENAARKKELQEILKQSNPTEDNKVLTQKIIRFNTVTNSIQAIEKLFSAEGIEKLKTLKGEFNTKKQAYKQAQELQKGNDPLDGVGTEAWKSLWDAAREFATKEIHPTIEEFPSGKSQENCVLCQQPLLEDGKNRMLRFSAFVADKTSKEFSDISEKINSQIEVIESSKLEITDTYKEIFNEFNDFETRLNEFQNLIILVKKQVLDYIKNLDKDEPSTFLTDDLSKSLVDYVATLTTKVEKNKELITNRSKYITELLDLEALEFLNVKKDIILKYFDEFHLKYWLNQCIQKTKTTSISKKIGNILESDSITLQHQEFVNHLTELNPSLANKIHIKKTKTANGETFQKCSFSEVNESIPNVLSEGEQKVVSLANFLSDCTIDNAKNSIVFDDPVTSLDQDYREAIAEKIVSLSSERQVIVFTHDLYFVRLLLDTHKAVIQSPCAIVGLKVSRGISGIVSDEIPYLAKNVQERVDTVKSDLRDIRNCDVSETDKIDRLLDSSRQRMRKLLEKSIEDILINRTIVRFSKNISAKRGNLASLIVVEKNDTDFLLGLFGKYSVTEHDGSVETIPLQPDEAIISQDLSDFCTWRDGFVNRVKAYKAAHNYS